jgi:hypothetical protein
MDFFARDLAAPLRALTPGSDRTSQVPEAAVGR